MTLRVATADDLPALTALLREHEATSMFALSNLAGAGLNGPGPYGMRFWVTVDVSGAIGLTNGGMLQPQWPGTADWEAVRAVLAGAEVQGVIGPAGQVRPLVDALGLGSAEARLSSTEPGFVLDLKDLIIPKGPGVLAGLDAADPAVLSGLVLARTPLRTPRPVKTLRTSRRRLQTMSSTLLRVLRVPRPPNSFVCEGLSRSCGCRRRRSSCQGRQSRRWTVLWTRPC
jgi:hypothetical protein